MIGSGESTQPNRRPGRDHGVESGLDADIYAKYRGELVRYATALVGPDDAEDVLSTVLVRVLRMGSLGSLDDPEAYLFRAVLNESRSVRRLVRDDHVEQAPDLLPEVIEALRRLPMRQRAAAYLVYYADLSVAEAAELMGCAPGTVKWYLHDARLRLRRDWRVSREQL